MLAKPKGEWERGWFVVGIGERGKGEMAACEGCADWGRDMERSEVGVLSSTAEDEGGCWLAWRVEM
jgi:hypothetical protein